MLEWLNNIDRGIFFAINGYHTDWLDAIMSELSGSYFWLLAILAIGFLLIKQFGNKGWILILAGGLIIAISDQTCNLAKANFKRERPTHNPELIKRLTMVNDKKGGTYGFYSGHASNSFAICAFAYFLLRRRLKGAGWIFAFGFLTSYSRIYLGVHYPFDVMAGAIIGFCWGLLGYLGLSRIKVLKLEG